MRSSPCVKAPASSMSLHPRRRREYRSCRGIARRRNDEVVDSSCMPVTDALVDIWHRDAVGIYSWYAAAGEHERVGPAARAGVLTVQLYFPEGVTDAVHGRSPYASRSRRDTTND